MKECNICRTVTCNPSEMKLRSEETCKQYTPISKKFKLPELISRVTIINTNSPTLKRILEYAQLYDK